MATGDRRDPYLGFRFLVEIEGLHVGGFSEVTGLQTEVEVEEFREGGLNAYIHKFAGPVRYPSNVVLKHGIVDSDILWRWHQDVAQGTVKRRNVEIKFQDSAAAVKWRWVFKEALPIKWTGPDLHGATAEVAVETLELVHRGLARLA